MGEPATAGRWSPSRSVGLVGGAAGLAASVFVLFGPVVRFTSERPGGRVTTGTVAGIDYLLGAPHAQFELFAWPVLLGAVTLVGAAAAWRGRPRWTGAAGLALAAFAVAGAFTIGPLYAPAAVLLLVAAVLGRGEG